MEKFLLIYYAPAEAMQQMATATPEEKEAGMGAWMTWKEKVGDAILDFGSPLMPGEVCDATKNYTATNNEITGYSLIQANSLEEAKKMVLDHPHLGWWEGCKVEIRPCIKMG